MGRIDGGNAQASYYSGDLAGGLQTWSKLLEKAKARGDDLQRAWGCNGRAEGILRLGGEDGAEQSVQLLEEALQLFGQNVDRVSEFGTYGLMSLAQLRRADLAAARKSADAGMKLAIALATPSAYYTFNGYFGVARTYLRLWEDALASDKASLAKLSKKACRALDRYARMFPMGQPAACLCQGIDQWLSGRKSAALRSWRTGLSAAERLRMPYSQALVHCEIVRYLPPDDPQRSHHIESARNLLERQGVEYDPDATDSRARVF